MIDISAPELAEAIVMFVMSDETICEDFCDKRDYAFEIGIGGLSMAEYVEGYKLKEFENWLKIFG